MQKLDQNTNITQTIKKAIVVNSNDKYKIGRIQVRIPELHGTPGQKTYIKDEHLPWALPCLPFASGEDTGSFIIPVPGMTVWVLFEDLDKQHPVYIGSSFGRGTKVPRGKAGVPEGNNMNVINNQEANTKHWQCELTPTSGRTEPPREFYENKTHPHPDRAVIYKSQTGHVLFMDDTTEQEKVVLIDRLGQMMVFDCPSFDKGFDMLRREDHKALEDSQLPSNKARILFRSGKAPDMKTTTEVEIMRQGTRVENYDTDGTSAQTVWTTEEFGRNKSPKDPSSKHKDHIMDTSCNNRMAAGVRTTIKRHNIIWDVTDDYIHGNYNQSNFFLDKDMIRMNVNFPFLHIDDKDVEICSCLNFIDGKPYTLWEGHQITSETIHTFFRQYKQEILMYVESDIGMKQNPIINITDKKIILSVSNLITPVDWTGVAPTQVILEDGKITMQVGLVAGGEAVGPDSGVAVLDGNGFEVKLLDQQLSIGRYLFQADGFTLSSTNVADPAGPNVLVMDYNNLVPTTYEIMQKGPKFTNLFLMSIAGIMANGIPIGPPIPV